MLSPPHFLALDLTGVCNFRCTTCVLDQRYPDPILMPREVLDALTPVLPLVGGVAVGCNAEPLLHPRAAEWVAWIRARTAGRMLVITNASVLDDARGAALRDAAIDELAVSIDGATAATFEHVRLRADFAQVRRNVERFAAARAGRGPALTVIFTSMAENVGELAAVVELAASWGATRLVVNGYEPYVEERSSQRLWKTVAEDRAIETSAAILVGARERGAALGVEVVLPELVARAVSTCSFVTPVVGPQGAVSPCPALSYAREVPLRPQPIVYARRVFGQLPQRSFREIWEDPAYVAFREQATCGTFRDASCAGCLVATGAICPRA